MRAKCFWKDVKYSLKQHIYSVNPLRKGIKVDDLVAIKSIRTPELSPDGSKVVYILGSMNLKENRIDKDVFLVEPDEEPRKLTDSGKAGIPRLFLHGEMDNDTPICEAEQFFMVLKKMGIDSRMVRYVDDGHGIRKKPINYLDSMRRTIDWFEKYL